MNVNIIEARLFCCGRSREIEENGEQSWFRNKMKEMLQSYLLLCNLNVIQSISPTDIKRYKTFSLQLCISNKATGLHVEYNIYVRIVR